MMTARALVARRGRAAGGGDGETEAVVRWAETATPLGPLRLYSTARGLLTVALPGEARPAAEARVRRILGRALTELIEDERAHEGALRQLADYFAGARHSFDLPLDPRGTPFQRLVWEAVAAIPRGETRTYGDIARAIGRAAARAVGAANGANPLPILIPCHRLVGANGDLIRYGRHGGGLDLKLRLLALEGWETARPQRAPAPQPCGEPSR